MSEKQAFIGATHSIWYFYRQDVGGQACFPSEELYRKGIHENLSGSGKLDVQSETIQ